MEKIIMTFEEMNELKVLANDIFNGSLFLIVEPEMEQTPKFKRYNELMGKYLKLQKSIRG